MHHIEEVFRGDRDIEATYVEVSRELIVIQISKVYY